MSVRPSVCNAMGKMWFFVCYSRKTELFVKTSSSYTKEHALYNLIDQPVVGSVSHARKYKNVYVRFRDFSPNKSIIDFKNCSLNHLAPIPIHDFCASLLIKIVILVNIQEILAVIVTIASYYKQLAVDIKMYNIRLKLVLLAPRCRRHSLTKLGLILWLYNTFLYWQITGNNTIHDFSLRLRNV